MFSEPKEVHVQPATALSRLPASGASRVMARIHRNAPVEGREGPRSYSEPKPLSKAPPPLEPLQPILMLECL